MKQRNLLIIIFLVILLLTACSTQTSEDIPQQSVEVSQSPYEDSVNILDNEKDLVELLRDSSKGSYEFEYYYRPTTTSKKIKFKHIELNNYQIKFIYTTDEKDINKDIAFLWFFSQPDGDLWIKNGIERNGYIYVYPDNPAEGVKYMSDLNRDEAEKEGRITWDVDYSVNGILFRANVPWDVSNEDVTKYLEMEKVEMHKN